VSYKKDEVSAVTAKVLERAVNELGSSPEFTEKRFNQIVIGFLVLNHY
jgi:hypothetical protein